MLECQKCCGHGFFSCRPPKKKSPGMREVLIKHKTIKWTPNGKALPIRPRGKIWTLESIVDNNTKLFFKEIWVIVIDIYQKLNRKLESSLYIIILKIKLLVCYAVWTVTCSARLIFWHLLILRVDSEQLSISIHLFSVCLLVHTVLFQNEKRRFWKWYNKW